jgi:hypothetical protein
MPGIYYVREKDLWNDTLTLYATGEFPLALAENLKKMTKRIVGSKRFDSCSDLLRDEMISRSFTYVCLALWDRKFDPKHGSRVYSWASRVILNECIKTIQEEQKRKKNFGEFAVQHALTGYVEIVTPNP